VYLERGAGSAPDEPDRLYPDAVIGEPEKVRQLVAQLCRLSVVGALPVAGAMGYRADLALA
jgi:hypothetical protein